MATTTITLNGQCRPPSVNVGKTVPRCATPQRNSCDALLHLRLYARRYGRLITFAIAILLTSRSSWPALLYPLFLLLNPISGHLILSFLSWPRYPISIAMYTAPLIEFKRSKLMLYLGSTQLRSPSLRHYGRYVFSDKSLLSIVIRRILTVLQAGVTHCFVNLGSDHPSILEAMVKGQKEKPDEFPKIVTCPNEVRRSF